MARYSVVIPKSKTKRFNKEPRTIVVTLDGGWVGASKSEYEVQPDQLGFEFEVPDGFEYVWNTSVLDGNVFDVEVIYFNASKSMSETIKLVPEKVNER